MKNWFNFFFRSIISTKAAKDASHRSAWNTFFFAFFSIILLIFGLSNGYSLSFSKHYNEAPGFKQAISHILYNDQFSCEISVSDDKWNTIKKQFNNTEKEYKYQDENIDIKTILSKFESDSNDDMKSIFGELVEYK